MPFIVGQLCIWFTIHSLENIAAILNKQTLAKWHQVSAHVFAIIVEFYMKFAENRWRRHGFQIVELVFSVIMCLLRLLILLPLP